MRRAALFSSALVIACGRGEDVHLGSVSAGGSGGATNGACGSAPCADHRGTRVFVDPSAPADAPDRFDAGAEEAPGTDATREPVLLYPSHETMFPINVAAIRHEWSPGEGNSLFELRFEGPHTTVVVYTARLEFVPDAEQWDWIAESNRGHAVDVSVRALDPAAPEVAWRSRAITSHFSAASVPGAIYYWSTATQGVVRALVSDTNPVQFYTAPNSGAAPECVGCHTLSRDGTRLAVGYGGEQLRVVTVPEREVLLPRPSATAPMPVPPPGKAEELPAAWSTFSPEGDLVLVAAKGTLSLIDVATGELVGGSGGALALPPETVATHPDWSPSGSRIALTLGGKGGDKQVEAGSIAVARYDGVAFGDLEVVVASAGKDDNYFFPSWSPDERLIAYVHAQGSSKDALSATIELFDVERGEHRSAVRLNQRVGPSDGLAGLGNTMPTWAPTEDGGVAWLAFSSVRAYATLRPQDDKLDQLWLAAIDTREPDPSYAAFWAPFQSLDAGNHRAFWTRTGETRPCRCEEMCGDGLDDDCDGSIDEPECRAACEAREICDDGLDNDCDCVVDACAAEICDDGVDNDGDDQIDAADPSCAP